MYVSEAELDMKELKEFVVIGYHKENDIVTLMDSFDTKPEAETFIGIASMGFESDGVKYDVYQKVI